MRSEQERFVFSLMLKGTTKFTCDSENTLTDIEMGGDLSDKDKGSQLPKVSKASGKQGGTSSVPGEEDYDIPLVIAFMVKEFWEGKVFIGIFVVLFQ